jgi:3-dehydrosphinganine reductase
LSSTGPDRFAANYALVASAKAAVEALCRYLTQWLRKDGVRINVLRTLGIQTESFQTAFGGEFADVMTRFCEAKRMPTLDDVAGTALALCSVLMDGVNGQRITVDRGLIFDDNIMRFYLERDRLGLSAAIGGENMNFSHAIITGGSSGIGKACALLLAARGTDITIIARRPAVLDAARGEIEQARVKSSQIVRTHAVDVIDRTAVQAAIFEAERSVGPCDLLVTSAGIARPGYFEELPEGIFERTMAINYFGTLYAVQAVTPGMRQRRHGRIAMISSGAGIIGVFGYAAYSPTKFALRGLAEVLRAELKPDGIGVSIVYPPDTDTPQLAEENRFKPNETKAITGTAKTLSADQVARSILDGLDRGRFAINPGLEMRALYRLHSLLLPLLNRHFDRVAAKARRS